MKPSAVMASPAQLSRKTSPGVPRLAALTKLPVPLRIGLLVLALLVVWLPLALPLYAWLSPNRASLLAMPLLYGEFLALVKWWNWQVYGETQPLQRYGFRGGWGSVRELGLGLGMGLGLLGMLFTLEGAWGWLTWQAPVTPLGPVVLGGLGVALGVGLAEELLFRGWLLDELGRDYSAAVALLASSLIYALLHFIHPWTEILATWTQFPGLVVLGWSLGWAKACSRGRLGLAIGIHGGLVWGYYLVRVGGLVTYPPQAPLWLTGLNQNPLAGGMGLLFLVVLAWGLRRQAHSQMELD